MREVVDYWYVDGNVLVWLMLGELVVSGDGDYWTMD